MKICLAIIIIAALIWFLEWRAFGQDWVTPPGLTWIAPTSLINIPTNRLPLAQWMGTHTNQPNTNAMQVHTIRLTWRACSQVRTVIEGSTNLSTWYYITNVPIDQICFDRTTTNCPREYFRLRTLYIQNPPP